MILILAWCATKAIPQVQLESSVQEITLSWDITADIYTKFWANLTWCTGIQVDAVADYTCTNIKWYLHSYYASGIGAKITYNSIDQERFFQQDAQAPITWGEDSIYTIENPQISLKMIEKDSEKTPDQIIQGIKIPSNCTYTTNEDKNNPDRVIYTSDCQTNNISTEYIFNKKKPTYYYQNTYTDTYNFSLDAKIELFLK